MSLHELHPSFRQQIWDILTTLFPIYRTIMGSGFQESLTAIQRVIPVRVLKFPSGQKCGSWTIPKEWTIHEAYIEDNAGKRIIDFSKNKFHVWQYSRPFSETISRTELLTHIAVSEKAPDAIPLNVTVYNENWGFSLTKRQRDSLNQKNYKVKIESSFSDGHLMIGELVIPGQTKEEILIDAVLSCSSLANNLSGVAAAVCLAQLVSSLKHRRYTYRFLFTPETIGPIAYHYNKKTLRKNIIGGVTLINLADENHFHYKRSRCGDSICDQAIEHSLRHSKEKWEFTDYDVLTGTCGNEKAYNSLGIEIPLGSFRRSPPGSYPQYDTSADNLEFINQDKLFSSLQILWGAIRAIEQNHHYKHCFEGEPFLTGYGLFPKIKSDEDRIPYDYLMGFSSGSFSLLEIAEKAKTPITAFEEPVRLMLEKKLIKKLNIRQKEEL